LDYKVTEFFFYHSTPSFTWTGQRDSDVYGDNSKVWCGKKDSDDVYEKAVFRVTITPKYDETKSPLDLRIVPWTDEMGN